MEERKHFRLACLAAALLCASTALPSHSAERVRVHPCHGCTKEQETAVALARGGNEPDVYIGNARTLRKYRLDRDADGALHVHAMDVEAVYLDAYQRWLRFHDTKPYGFRKHYAFQLVDPRAPRSASFRAFHEGGRLVSRPIGPGGELVYPIADYADPSATVYDAVRPGPRRDGLLQAVRDAMLKTVGVHMDELAAVLAAFDPVDAMRPTVDVTLHFADGGRAMLKLDEMSLAYGVVEDQARDSHGNTVPTSVEAMKDTIWTFDFRGPGNGKDRRAMRDWLSQLGVRFHRVPPNAMHYLCGHRQAVAAHAVAVCEPDHR